MTSATSAAAAPPAADAIPKRRFDLRAGRARSSSLALVAWPAVGSSSTWFTLTVAGLAMGMIIFIAASGLTLVFGLMDVLNFGHSLFIALGAYIATSVFVVARRLGERAEHGPEPRRDRRRRARGDAARRRLSASASSASSSGRSTAST